MNQLKLRACAGFASGLIGVACGADGSTEPNGDESMEAAGDEPMSEFRQEAAALSPCITGQSLAEQCKRLKRLIGKPYLDAYTGGNGDVVTRDFESNSTQTWCFTLVDEGIEDPTAPSGVSWAKFTLQHRTFRGQYLDAYSSSNDHKAVLRNAKNTSAQIWRAEIECSAFHLVQESTGRHLDAHTSSSNDYRAVTRTARFDGSQAWSVE